MPPKKQNRTQPIPITPLTEEGEFSNPGNGLTTNAQTDANTQIAATPNLLKNAPTPSKEAETFSLEVQPPKALNETKNQAASVSQTSQTQKTQFAKTLTSLQSLKNKFSPSPSTSSKSQQPAHANVGIKIWNTLEWLATSAIIFMLAFFLINYQSYSEIFWQKLDTLRGKINNNQYTQEIAQNHSASTQTVEQKPLPVVKTSEQSKKQVPYLDIQVAPPDDRVIIPRIGKNIPIVKVSSENLIKRDWTALEADIQNGLQDGVVHYPNTAEPGQKGNVVITGHSSYFPWDPGRFKDVFAALHNVAVGDEVIVYHDQKPYHYKIYDIKKVRPTEVDVLTSSGEERLTLITCTPIGTNLNRLIVLAKPV